MSSYDVKNIFPNVKVLRDEGVPQYAVFTLLSKRAYLAFMSPSMFVEYVNFIKGTGIMPFEAPFVEALLVITKLSKSTWESKLDIFERLGWSRDVTLLAFSKFPPLMCMSEKNITDTMKFLVDEMDLPLKDIARCPAILGLSLTKRIIPRWSVVKILKMKGLIKDDRSPFTVIIPSEKRFLQDFVIKFQESVPELLKLYREESRSLPEAQA
ncbi:transcription termination factor MTERF15, mitochondrial-like [Neltuma alba]|nr:transcription termination factor MTERF15, mitochondrial-like [Prosopis alba]